MSLRRWLREMAGRSRWIVGGLALGLVVGGGLAHLAAPRYAADTTLYVSSGLPSTDNQSAYQAALVSQQRMKSYVELVTGDRVAQGVVDSLGLRESAADVAQHISAVSQQDTWVLTVTATDGTAGGAARLANATAASFEQLVTQLEQPPGNAGPQSPVQVQVVQRATPPSAPAAPSVATYLLLGGLIGLLCGVGAAGLRRSLDDSVRTAASLAAVLDAPVLGVVPRSRQRRGADDPAQAEAFRRVRANLEYGNRPDGARVVLVTGAGARGAHTAAAHGLAAAFATGQERVLVVDTDESTAPGTPVLPQMRTLLDELRERYDLVLVVAPPVLESADSLELAAVVDGTIVVAQCGRSRQGQVAAAVEALSGVRARLLGGILTDVPARELPARPARRRVATARPATEDLSDPRHATERMSDDWPDIGATDGDGTPGRDRLRVPTERWDS